MENNKYKKTCDEMTLEEKTQLINGASFFGMYGIDRLFIPGLQLLDGGTGINFEQLFGDILEKAGTNQPMIDGEQESVNGMNGQTALSIVIDHYYEPEKIMNNEKNEDTKAKEASKILYCWMKEQLKHRLNGKEYAPGCYPPGIFLGATWNPSIVEQVGEALGKEGKLYQVHVLLGTPNVNIHRAVLNGRLFEGYSEDPCLISKLAPALVKGVQSQGVLANVKHFAANNQEKNRVGINEWISERALEEIYYPGFKACVKEGKVATVMSAYNKINGIPCTENAELLTKKLRQEWGFDGVVLSDWGAVYHPVEALKAGNDLAMPGPISGEPVRKAIASGELSMEELNQSVLCLLKMIDKSTQGKKANQDMVQLQQHTDEIAYKAACEGIVLLENDGILPLKADTVNFEGTGKDKLLECGTGSAGITTNRVGDLKKCMEEYVTISETEADCTIFIATNNGMEGNDRKDMHMDKRAFKCFMNWVG